MTESEIKKNNQINRSSKYYLWQKALLKVGNKSYDAGYFFMTNFRGGMLASFQWREDGVKPILEYDYGIKGIISKDVNSDQYSIIGFYYSYETTYDEEVINSVEKKIKLTKIN